MYTYIHNTFFCKKEKKNPSVSILKVDGFNCNGFLKKYELLLFSLVASSGEDSAKNTACLFWIVGQ